MSALIHGTLEVNDDQQAVRFFPDDPSKISPLLVITQVKMPPAEALTMKGTLPPLPPPPPAVTPVASTPPMALHHKLPFSKPKKLDQEDD